jgi:parallel beta-helix repeat protein
MNRKMIALFLTMLMCLTTVIVPNNNIVTAYAQGKTLYVGGTGHGNYSSIQTAIGDATSGNTTIFVYNGTYSENLVVNKTINLTGEGDDAIIDGGKDGSAVLITADWVNLTGFAIQNGGGEDYDAGIKIISDHVNISNNVIKDCDAQGVYLEQASNNTIWNNTFTNIINTSTIFLWNSSNTNSIRKNIIDECGCAIEIGNGSSYNNLSENIVNNNTFGIYLWINTTINNSISKNVITNTTCDGLRIEGATNNNIFENWFENNDVGISIYAVNSTAKNKIYHNNFINNTEHFIDESNQSWDNGYPSGGNYWDDYDGSDEFSGCNQNITGSDGLGDSPYFELDNITIDSYPLLCCWGEYLPVAVFTYTLQNKTVSFNGSASYDRDGDIANWTWSFGDTSTEYGEKINHTYSKDDAYNVSLKVIDDEGKNNTLASYIVVGNDTQPPVITSISNTPETVGFGFNVNISANVTDNFGVDIVLVNVTYPNAWYEYFTMTHVTGNNYRYEFTDTWRNGNYNYTIWVVDHSNNSNSSNVFDFTVSSQATITVGTLKDMYGDNEYINITDPPNPPENLTVVGRGLNWNTYYNASSGSNILEAYQTPVNYQEDNGTWTPINNSFYILPNNHPAYSYGYRTGNAHGLFGVYFKPDVSDNWPVAFTFNRSSNPTTDVIRSKLVGVGYLDPQSNWAYHYLQSAQSSQGQTNGNTITYPGVFNGTDVSWTYRNMELKEAITLSNTTKTLLQNHPPSMYGLNDASSYLVFITKLDHQNLNLYNTSGMLIGNVTITDTGVDFKDALGQFKCALPLGEAYELNNESARQQLIYRIIHLNGITYLLSGLKVSKLNTMTFPVVIDPTLSVNSLSNDGYIWKSDRVYNTAWSAPIGTVDSSSTYLSIGQKFSSSFYYIYRGFVLFNTASLPWNAYLEGAILSLYKKDDFSTTDFNLIIQNGQPTYPHNPLQTPDYNKMLYSGNGGSLSTANFVNGRNNITLTNLNWVNRTGITKLCLRSSRDISGTTPTGNEYVNVYSANAPTTGYVPKLIITYRNQSKIKNTGSMDIKGYLLLQIQYFNATNSSWIVDNETVDETLPRKIRRGEQLGLDTIFNGLVNTWNLSHGNGAYRVYAAFRDSSGNVLQINDSVLLNASFEFNVSMDFDSDDDGWKDFEELNFYYTDPYNDDTDDDGFIDSQDVDPLVNLEVTVTTKRIYASEYTYTWREGESWDWSETNTSGATDETEWVICASSEASNGHYTRQNDAKEGYEDFAMWNFTVLKTGLYHIWMRSHRYNEACSNVSLTWIDKTTTPPTQTNIYSRGSGHGSDHSRFGSEILWYQNTTDEWKWSWYGVVDVEETGEYSLKINNTEAYPDPDLNGGLRDDLGYSHGDEWYWMEVDNILITDDPNCIPNGKGIEGSTDDTIGSNSLSFWDTGEGPGGFGPDFYVKVTIADETITSGYGIDDYNNLSDWQATVDVPDDTVAVPITIELWEEDGDNDMQCDISRGDEPGSDGMICNIVYNFRNGTWWGDDYVNDTDTFGRTCGEADGTFYPALDANVIFTVSQTDVDNDGITYWQELNIFGDRDPDPFHPNVKNDRYAVIVGGGASCKLFQTSNNGSYRSPYIGPYLLYEKGSGWTDYTLTVDLMTMDDWDIDKPDIGVIFRYQDEENYYILRWEQHGTSDWMFLQKVVNNISSNLASPKHASLWRGDWYSLKIVVDGDNIKVLENDNRVDEWNDFDLIFDVTDDTFSDGSIALFCWRNKKAYFDDILVTDSDDDVLLVEGFDYSHISTDWTIVDGVWSVTAWSTDQEEMYKELDFLYRELINTFHYNENNIYYLSAHKWRDADGDNNFDVHGFSMKSTIQYVLQTWFKESSDGNDLNFVYIITHGYYQPVGKGDYSLNKFDEDRDGHLGMFEFIKDSEVADWLKNNHYGTDIGRLVFLIDSCFSGHYIDTLSKSGEDRIIMASSSIYEPAELETGQDWGAFSYKFFSSMANGETTIASAFNKADYHIANNNFMTIWVIKKWNYTFWPQDARLDDNGNGLGSKYTLPSEGDWYNVYEGSYSGWETKNIQSLGPDSKILKVRVRFNTRIGELFPDEVSAKLHEIKFHIKDTNTWITPDGFYDQWDLWDNEDDAYDGHIGTEASCSKNTTNKYPWGDDVILIPPSTSLGWFWTSYLEFTFNSPISCDKLKFHAWYSTPHCNRIDIDAFYPGYQEGILAGQTGL